MIAAKNLQPFDCSHDDVSGGLLSVSKPSPSLSRSTETDESVNAHIRFKRLQQYVAYMEMLLLRKNSELSNLQRSMELHVADMRQKQFENERVMIHQARHAAMGEMLGTIAHQWRQPLHVISLVVQNMQDAWEFGDFNRELFDRSIFQTMEQVMFLSRTIDDFRTFLNPAKSTEYFNPIQCVEECTGLLSGWFSNFPGIEVRAGDEEDKNIMIAGCQNAFNQVIMNVLNNASEAVQSEQRRRDPTYRGRITIDSVREGADAIIRIADNGGGISETTMEHIFEPYFTTKDKANGIGIGLYVSRLIIENSMNGSLRAENRQSGALFSIRLPVAFIDEVRI